MINMINLRILLVLAFVMGPAASAWAAKKEPRPSPSLVDKPAASAPSSKEEKERAAKKACLNHDADKGVELLTDLYVDTNDPTYIFNQGRCYEQNDRCQDAIVRFREYLRKTPAATEGDRNDAQKHILDCETLLAKRAGEPPASVPAHPVAGPVVPAAAGAQPSEAAVAPAAQLAVAEARPAPSGGTGSRTAGVITASAGVAIVAGAVVLNLQHNGMISDLKADYSGDTADTAKTYKTLAIVGYGVGAACLVGGAALYWLGVRAGRAQVGPAMVAGNAGVMMAGGF
jgi:hypothetical protein